MFNALMFQGCKEEEILIGTAAEFRPFEYVDGGEFKGIDMDIIREIARRANLNIKIKDMKFDSIIMALSSGSIDVAISALTISSTREKMVHFTPPYYEASQVAIVPESDVFFSSKKSVESLISAIDSRVNLRIGVASGQTGAFYALGDEDWGFKGFKKAKVLPFANGSLAINALKNHQIDIVIIDKMPAIILTRANPNTKIIPLSLTSEQYAIGVNPSKKALLAKINSVLDEIKKDGTLESIISKYMTSPNYEENLNNLQDSKDSTKDSKNDSTQDLQHQAQILTLNPSNNQEANNSSMLGLRAKIDVFYQQFIIKEGYKIVIKGLLVTIALSIAAFIVGSVIGCVVGIFATKRHKNAIESILMLAIKGYTGFFRGTPIIVQLLFIYFALLPLLGLSGLNALFVAMIIFGLNSGAYVGEIMRSAILSVDRGQEEAALSLGLNTKDRLRFIILPQALKNAIPNLCNEFITLLKETSVANYIAVHDLTYSFYTMANASYENIIPYFCLAVCYLLLVVLASAAVGIYERRLRASDTR